MPIYQINNLPTTPTTAIPGLKVAMDDINKMSYHGGLGTNYFISRPADIKFSILPGGNNFTHWAQDKIKVKINTTSSKAKYDVRIFGDYQPKLYAIYGNSTQQYEVEHEQINENVSKNAWATVYGEYGGYDFIPKYYDANDNPKYRGKKFYIEITTDDIVDFTIDIELSALGRKYKVTKGAGAQQDGETIYWYNTVLYTGVPVVVLKNIYTVTIDKTYLVNQPKWFKSDYYFNFKYSIIKSSNDFFAIPSNGDGTEVYLLEYNNESNDTIYTTAKNIYQLISPPIVANNEYPNNATSQNIKSIDISSKLILKSNTRYKLFIRTYYGKLGSKDFVNSNIIDFTTSKIHPNSLVNINSGYYLSEGKYFYIPGSDPNQTISTPGSFIRNSSNILSPSDNTKRKITINGSVYLFYDTNNFIFNDWFNEKPKDKPTEIGFYYIKSPSTPKKADVINVGTKVAKDPTNTQQTEVKILDSNNLRAISFEATIDGLDINTTYFYVSFMKNGNDSYYGELQSFTTLPINILSFTTPSLSPGQKWYQIYDNWELANDYTVNNIIKPFYRIRPIIAFNNKFIYRNYPIFYYFKADFFREKNYQFRTIVENFYDYIFNDVGNVEIYMVDNSTKLTIKTPWGESNLFTVPYFKDAPSNGLINLFLYSNINSINISNKPIDSISSNDGSNPKNPITYIANGYFTTPLLDPRRKSQGLIYTDVNDTDWILQGYAFFNFFNARRINPNLPYNNETTSNVNNMVFDGDDEVISIMDNNNTPIGCKGWHLIEKKNQLVWFDKYVPLSIDQWENSRNLPVGGNPDDYYSNKTSEEKWRQNNYVAKYIQYQSFNISFTYNNTSNSSIYVYVGSKLPKYENGEINYFDDFKLIAKLDKFSPAKCEFIGLEGNQYIYFVAEPIKLVGTGTTYSMITLGDFKFAGSYNEGNNLLYGITKNNGSGSLSTTNNIDNATYSIKLGNSNNVDTDETKYNDPIILKSSSGNGTFKAGIWENGVWNSGWRDDTTKKDFYKIDQFFSYDKDKKWQIRISGASSSVSEFSVGDKVSISNIVAVDINDERKLLKNHYNVIEATKNYISFEFESDFPLRRVEMDSDEHRIGVTKNIWLSGIFLNGYFKGIWNNGFFSGYPLITKMDESHWIDGIFNGGHFTSRKYSVEFDNISNFTYDVDNSKRLRLIFKTPHKLNDNDSIVIYDDKERLVGSTIVLSVIDEMNLITGLTWETMSDFKYLETLRSGKVYSLISTGLVQNINFYSNNVSKVSSLISLRTERVFIYNSWMDVNYSDQSAVNIGKPYYFIEQASNKSYSENNLYGYPTNDILSSSSTFRDSFSTNSRIYKLGKKWKLFNDLVGDSSTFEEYFNTTDTIDGLQSFNTAGWDINKLDVNTKNININGVSSYLGTPNSVFSIYLNNYDYSNSIKVGDSININGWTSINRNDDTANKINIIGLTVSYIISHKVGDSTTITKPVYENLYSSDTDYTMIGFDNFSDNKNDNTIIRTLATMSYFGTQNGTLGVTSSVGPVYGPQSVNTYNTDLSKSKYMWSIDIMLDNKLVFSRTPEPLETSKSTIGKELKIDSNGEGGILNLIPAYDVNNRVNGGDTNTIDKSSYTMIEFDVLQNNSATNSYIDPNLGNIPIIHFNNLNYITKNFKNSGITYSQTIPTKYLPINSNVNHLSTKGTKKQEFFFNKRNLLMNLKGNGLLGEDSTEIFLDNIKMYQVDMVPFFQYFKKSNINISVQIPSNGTSPNIDYATDDNIIGTIDTNPIVTYFGNSLIGSNIEVPEGINWVNDYGITFSTI